LITFDEVLDHMTAQALPPRAKPKARQRCREAILRDRQEDVWRQVRREFAQALAEEKRP